MFFLVKFRKKYYKRRNLSIGIENNSYLLPIITIKSFRQIYFITLIQTGNVFYISIKKLKISELVKLFCGVIQN